MNGGLLQSVSKPAFDVSRHRSAARSQIVQVIFIDVGVSLFAAGFYVKYGIYVK